MFNSRVLKFYGELGEHMQSLLYIILCCLNLFLRLKKNFILCPIKFNLHNVGLKIILVSEAKVIIIVCSFSSVYLYLEILLLTLTDKLGNILNGFKWENLYVKLKFLENLKLQLFRMGYNICICELKTSIDQHLQSGCR